MRIDGTELFVRTAIISDIHGNLMALETVLADIDQRSVDEIICLGDILGYGPNPVECVDLVKERCEFSLLGNHDFAALYEPTNFNDAARKAAYWTRDELDRANEQDPESGRLRTEFLNRLRVRWLYNDIYTCVHGTVRRPINEYLFPEDPVNNPSKFRDVMNNLGKRGLVGHTHHPGVFSSEDADFSPASEENGEMEHPEPGDGKMVGIYRLHDDDKAIINPGSVGQPRDGDPRASYAILDTSSEQHFVEFIRLEYDIEEVANRIDQINELDEWLGRRLFEGK